MKIYQQFFQIEFVYETVDTAGSYMNLFLIFHVENFITIVY